MTGSAWTRWTLCNGVILYIKGRESEGGWAKGSVVYEGGAFLLSVFFMFFSSFFPTSFFNSFLVDFGVVLGGFWSPKWRGNR